MPPEILLEVAKALVHHRAPAALACLCRAGKVAHGLLYSLLYRSIRLYTREQVQLLHRTLTLPRGSLYAPLVRHLFVGFNACVFLAKEPAIFLVCPSLDHLDVEVDAFFCRTTFGALSLSPAADLTISRAGIHPSWIIKIISQQPALWHTLQSLHVHDMHFVFMSSEQSFTAADLASLRALRTVSLSYDLAVNTPSTTSARPPYTLITQFLPALEAFLSLAWLTHLRVYFHSAPTIPHVNLASFLHTVLSKEDTRLLISAVPPFDLPFIAERPPPAVNDNPP